MLRVVIKSAEDVWLNVFFRGFLNTPARDMCLSVFYEAFSIETSCISHSLL